jgi:uncharacterized Zn-finger protein
MLTHSVEKQYKCDREGCEAAFRYNYHLKRHLLAHDKEAPYPCTKCEATLKKHSQLKRHLLSEHLAEIEHYKCDTCDKVFYTEEERNLHEHKSKYLCGQCGESFEKWSLLHEHTKIHVNLKCDICGKTFGKRKNLLAHSKTHDQSRRVWTCSYEDCGKTFFRRYSLYTHIKKTHEQDKPYVCNHASCGKAFGHKHLLVRHVRSHYKELILEDFEKRNEARKDVKKDSESGIKEDSEKVIMKDSENDLMKVDNNMNILHSISGVPASDSSQKCSKCVQHFQRLYDLQRHKAVHNKL